METIQGPSGELFVDDGGRGGPPVLFLHSLAGTAAQWSAQLGHLRGGRRAAALELRGHGRSSRPADGDYGIEAYAADAAAAADGLGLDGFVVVGHSMGASVALEYAARESERVMGLLLVDGAQVVEPPTPAEAAWLDALDGADYPVLIAEFWETILAGAEPGAKDRVMLDLRATPQKTVARSFREVLRHDPVAAFARYGGPALLVVSDVGDGGSALHHHVRGLPHEAVRGTGHWLHMDRPAEFNRVLDGFLARVDGGH